MLVPSPAGRAAKENVCRSRGDSGQRGWAILRRPQFSREHLPGRHAPMMGSSEAAEPSANVKADLSWQRPSLPVSLVSWPLWDVSPSALRNVAIPIPFPVAVSPGRSAWAMVSDVSVQIQSPVLQSECITRPGASAQRFGFDNKSLCFHEFKSDFKTSPLMFF